MKKIFICTLVAIVLSNCEIKTKEAIARPDVFTETTVLKDGAYRNDTSDSVIR